MTQGDQQSYIPDSLNYQAKGIYLFNQILIKNFN